MSTTTRKTGKTSKTRKTTKRQAQVEVTTPAKPKREVPPEIVAKRERYAANRVARRELGTWFSNNGLKASGQAWRAASDKGVRDVAALLALNVADGLVKEPSTKARTAVAAQAEVKEPVRATGKKALRKAAIEALIAQGWTRAAAVAAVPVQR